ncbi:MAG: glycerophosphodiester phosphodiesterase [Clostridia bacterium]|nr:glycerophosphodiester phosphodiesterase [Clostridia bacterium]
MKRCAPAEVWQNGKTVITAHSGCEKTEPNSREHILAAIASGAEMIEFDVRMVEGELVLSHDVPENAASCVTLRDCFSLVAPEENLHMNIDVKTEGLIEPVMALAKEFPLDGRIIFTGACNDDRELALSLGADMWRSMWPGQEIEDGIAANQKDGSPFLNVAYCMITEENNKALCESGSGFSAWTVDKEYFLRLFLKMGISNITTRNPVLAMKLRKEIQGF